MNYVSSSPIACIHGPVTCISTFRKYVDLDAAWVIYIVHAYRCGSVKTETMQQVDLQGEIGTAISLICCYGNTISLFYSLNV